MTYLLPLEARFVELVDTGGMGVADGDNLSEHIEGQIQTAIDSADLILLVVDTRAGLTPLDQEVAKRIRYVDAPVICVANKTDAPSLDSAGRRVLQAGAEADPRQHAAEPRQGGTGEGHPGEAAGDHAGRRVARRRRS